MVQSLLEDRFQLKVHHEVRQLDVFNLVVANGGLKMKLSGDQTPPKSDDEVDTFDPASPPRGETSVTHTASGETVLSGAAISISPSLEVHRPHALPPRSLTGLLRQSGRLVIDKTNRKGFLISGSISFPKSCWVSLMCPGPRFSPLFRNNLA